MADGERGGALGACAACGAPSPEDGRLCRRCKTTADGLTPAIDFIEAPGRSSGTVRLSREKIDPDVRAPGTELGAYRIVELIGQGGIGHVYLADHVKLGRPVAIKMLRSQYGRVAGIVDRFFAEARAANQIAHENIVQITDFIEDDGDASYIVMELLDGADLEDVLEREGPLPIRRVLHVMAQVASALAAAHGAGIVHRDLKPENIFLIRRRSDPDFVKLLDFGVAKLTGDPGAANGLTTADGAVVGTPAYMSPEQARGRTVDHRTDVYSFGVILYELLTGRLPFEATTLGDFIIQHSTQDATPPSKLGGTQAIPAALDDLTMRCLRKEPDERPATMHEVERFLHEIASDEAPSLELQVVRPTKDRRPMRLGAAALLVCLAGAGAWALWPSEEPIAPPPVAAVAIQPPPEPEPTREPTPEVAPEPERATVTFSFTSEPPGAEVWPEGAAAPLGITPLSTTAPRTDGRATFELRLEGRAPVRQEVSLDRDANVQVVLPQLPRARSARSRRNAVIDPFD